MSTAVLAPVEPTAASTHWQWEALGEERGSTRVSFVGDELSVRVADLHGRSSLRSLLSARLGSDGAVVVTARYAPPALLVADGEVRLIPDGGCSTATASLSPGDVLVLRSAAALDAEPAGLVQLLKAGPHVVRDEPVGRLVRSILAGAPAGAAVVARYTG